MRLAVIACTVFTREISLIAAHAEPVLEVTWIRQGLHNYPDLLRAEIQSEIDRIESPNEGPDGTLGPPETPEAIVLAFGLCSRAIVGLTTRRLPLVAPRSHDCIAMLLGSRVRYQREFDAEPGTYWFSPGWIEQSTFPCGAQCSLMRDRFAERYGEDNAEYLVEVERSSLAAYRRAALVEWPELVRDAYRDRTDAVAREFGWRSERINGDRGLMERLLTGRWEESEAVVCPPGATLETGDEAEVIRVQSFDQPARPKPDARAPERAEEERGR